MTSRSPTSYAAAYSPINTNGVHEDSHEHEADIVLSEDEAESVHIVSHEGAASPGRAYFVRALALLCACSLSIGSH